VAVAVQTFSRTNFREFAFTIDNVKNRVIDHVFSHSPALAIFASQTLGDFGGVQMRGLGHATETGGHAVIKRVTLGEHAGASRMAGPFGTHNVAPDDNTRFAEGNWKFYSHGLAVSEHDLQINRGEFAISSFLEHQTQQVMRSLANLVADDIYADGGASAITELPALINASGAAVHGLDGDNYPQYNSRGVSAVGTAAASVSFASGSFAAQGLSDFRAAYDNASEGMIQPNVILTEHATTQRYEAALQPQERFAGAVRVADGSFQSLAFRTTPVIPDRKCDSGSAYFLRVGDDEGVRLHALAGADFDFGEWKPSSNQPVMVRPLFLTCELMIGNRQYGCNKLTGITD
jgi:hypothetical protein